MKPERNDPCPCGSGRKYKKCCGAGPSKPAPVSAPDPALLARGVQALQRGAFQDAVALGRKILDASPRSPDACCLCGLALRGLGDLPQARGYLEKAISLSPARVDYRAALAQTLSGLGEHALAVEQARRALEIDPRFAEGHSALAIALQALGRVDEGLAHLRTALELEPRNPAYYVNLGTARQQAGQYPEAEDSYRQAIRIAPDFAPGYANLGALYLLWEKYAAARAPLLKALALDPADPRALQNLDHLLYAANYSTEISREDIFAMHRRWGELIESQAGVARPAPAAPAPGARRIRLGYVSPDFLSHAAAYFIEPFIAHHDPEKFEITCYADVAHPDTFTERFRRYPHHWRDIAGKRDQEVAAMIRADGIDVLVDLAGHTKNNRLMVFALRPAPLQISYLGYPNTTGLTTIDYYITDAWADPEGMSEHLYTEKLVRLPGGFSCFRPEDLAPPIGPLPARQAGHVTFASLNILKKFNDAVAALWAQVLERVPGARLIIQCRTLAEPAVQQAVRERFAGFNIAPERLELLPGMSLADHLALYNRIDIALDPFPWNGHTTTSHALWMGVPVITLAGNTHSGRLATSVLCQAGLEELIAPSPEDYVARAVSLARDTDRLQALRSSLRERMAQSRHCDGVAFTRGLEELLTALWKSGALSVT
jgi:predicted O-linked N-acetylglucosamine transferase (SPINDLY family)